MTAVIAVEGHVDAGVPLHFGNPLGEQVLLRDGALVDLSHRGAVTVSGPDRLPWLHSLTSQHVEHLNADVPMQGLILSPHGHIEHDLHIVDDGTTTWITVEPGTAPSLVQYLDRMRFLLQVEVADVSSQYAVIGAMAGEDVPAAVVTWRASEDLALGEGRDAYVPHRPAAWPAREYVVRRQDLESVLASRPRAGTWAWEALRIAAGVPRLGRETDHRTIPHEVGLIAPAVHLQKGCYRGQETIARVHNLGRPPRRLVLLHLDGSDDVLPTHGDAVDHEGRVVGVIGSATHHHELGPIALAVIKRSVPVDVPVTVQASTDAGPHPVAATQETVVAP